jgi:hypothetical protein
MKNGGIVFAGLCVLVAVALYLTDTSPQAPAVITPSAEQQEVGRSSSSQTNKPARDSEAPVRAAPSEIRELRSLGYLAGYRAPEVPGGATTFQPERLQPGYTLFSSGHAPTTLLIDSSGEVRHSWFAPVEKAFPSYSKDSEAFGHQPNYWRYVHLLPDGSLLAIFEGIGIIKLDRESNVVWARENGAHHWVSELSDGNLAVLTRKRVPLNQSYFIQDAITILNGAGEELRSTPIAEAIKGTPVESIIFRNKNKPWRGDLLHTNSLTIIPDLATLPAGVSPGDYLVSMRTKSALTVISAKTGRAVWAHRGGYRTQHSAEVRPNGTLLLFDNTGSGNRGPSRVLRYDFKTMNRIASIEKIGEVKTFFSKLLGAVRELPNRNLLISESEAGRILEVTPEGQLVWEYVSPYRVGEKDEFIAVVAHAERIAFDQVGWLNRAE